jgi:hypothetical protein
MHTGGAVHEPDDVIAGAGPPAAATSSTVPEELNPQKYGMDAVADVSDGGRARQTDEGVEP